MLPTCTLVEAFQSCALRDAFLLVCGDLFGDVVPHLVIHSVNGVKKLMLGLAGLVITGFSSSTHPTGDAVTGFTVIVWKHKSGNFVKAKFTDENGISKTCDGLLVQCGTDPSDKNFLEDGRSESILMHNGGIVLCTFVWFGAIFLLFAFVRQTIMRVSVSTSLYGAACVVDAAK